MQCPSIVDANDQILVTGAAGFIGSIIVKTLLARGFRNVRCLVRPGSDLSRLEEAARDHHAAIELVRGNLLSRDDCETAAANAAIVFHLAASRGEKPIADAFMNSVVTTRNLLEAARRQSTLRRFVNVSSLAVYSNRDKPRRRLLDESCPVDARPELRGDAYSFCKVMQDEIVGEYGSRFGIPVVTVRPGFVYGPGQRTMSARIGVDTFGMFLHLGGGNTMPFTFVDNCADAIVRAGTTPGVDGRVFNVVDDDLPSSRQFLRLYKRHVRSFRSIYIPHAMSYAACWLWERYSRW